MDVIKVCMNERVIELINECNKTVWMNEWMNEWMHECMNDWINKLM
jgi:hypothetical protein